MFLYAFLLNYAKEGQLFTYWLIDIIVLIQYFTCLAPMLVVPD